MTYFILILHFLLCILMIGLVLLQQGKGADMGAAFGAGGSNTLFGAGGADRLVVRLTTGAAILFFITTIILANQFSEIGLARTQSVVVPKAVEEAAREVNAANPTASDIAVKEVAPESAGNNTAKEDKSGDKPAEAPKGE